MTEPAATAGIGQVGRAARVRAADGRRRSARAVSFVATQLRKNAAQSAFFALAAMPYVSGADMAPCGPPSWRAGSGRSRPCPAVGVVAGVLPVAVEHEHALALAEARVGVGVLDGVDVLGK